MILQTKFDSHFEVEEIEHSSVPPDCSFGEPNPGRNTFLLQVTPWNGKQWVGQFASPAPGIRALDTVLKTPHPLGLCVIVGGEAFLGNVLEPAAFRPLTATGPIASISSSVIDRVLVLASPWTLTIINRNLQSWTSPRLSIDGLHVDSILDGKVHGLTDPEGEEPKAFEINIPELDSFTD